MPYTLHTKLQDFSKKIFVKIIAFMKKGLARMGDNCIFFSFVCSVLTNKLFLLIKNKSGEESMGNYLQKFELKMYLSLLT